MGLTQISTGGVKNDAVTAAKIPTHGVGQSEIADDSIGHGEIKANAVVTEKIASSAVTQVKINDQAINEAKLQISNNGTNGQFLSKQSGNSGGLTWATPTSYTHPNHSGEVTSTADGAQVIADDVVDEANLKVSNSPNKGQFLSAQSGNTGGLTWADAGGGAFNEYDVWKLDGGNATSWYRWQYDTIGADNANQGYLTQPSDWTANGRVGTGMSESAGIFTFPSTGFWKIELNLAYRASYSTTNGSVFIDGLKSTNSGTSWPTISEGANRYHLVATHGAAGNGTTKTMYWWENVTNATNTRWKWQLWTSSSLNLILNGNTSMIFSRMNP